MRLLADHHHDLGSLRTQAVCRLHALVRCLIPGGTALRLSASRAGVVLRGVRPTNAVDAERKRMALGHVADIRRLDAEIAASKARIVAAVAASGTSVTELYGVGPVVAAFLIGHSGDMARFANRDHYASYNATAPVLLWVGNTELLDPGAGSGDQLATHAPPYNAPSDAAPERAAARSQQRRLQCPVSGDRDRTRQGDPPGALSAGLDGPCRRGLRTGGLSESSRVRIRRPPKKVPPPESPKGAEDSSTGRRNTMGVVLRQLISGMASGHGERDRKTSPRNVTPQRHPATSPRNVTPQRHPATSPRNVTPQRHPATSPRNVTPQRHPATSPRNVTPQRHPATSPRNVTPQRHPATSPCNVTLQRHPATSPCNVTLQRHPATSPCNVTLQRHPATSPCNVTLPGRGTVAHPGRSVIDVQLVRFRIRAAMRGRSTISDVRALMIYRRPSPSSAAPSRT